MLFEMELAKQILIGYQIPCVQFFLYVLFLKALYIMVFSFLIIQPIFATMAFTDDKCPSSVWLVLKHYIFFVNFWQEKKTESSKKVQPKVFTVCSRSFFHSILLLCLPRPAHFFSCLLLCSLTAMCGLLTSFQHLHGCWGCHCHNRLKGTWNHISTTRD